jgi:hypothetical protein
MKEASVPHSNNDDSSIENDNYKKLRYERNEHSNNSQTILSDRIPIDNIEGNEILIRKGIGQERKDSGNSSVPLPPNVERNSCGTKIQNYFQYTFS